MSAAAKNQEDVNTDLTRKEEAFVTAMLSEPTIGAAAKVAGVSEATARRWLTKPPVQRAYRDARRQVVEHSLSTIQRATNAAVVALLRNLREDAPPAVQVRAATALLEYAVRGVEVVDLTERIEHIEQMLQQQSHR